jgi:hypothetical protein
MRTLFAALAALLSVLLTAVAVPAIWLDRNVVSSSGFVALASPLGTGEDFRAALADSTAKAVVANLNVPPILLAVVQPVIVSSTRALTEDPGYPAAWQEMLRRSHVLTVERAAEGAEDDTALTLDVAPMLNLVVDKVAAGLGQQVSMPEEVPITLGGADQRETIAQVVRFAPLGYWLGGAAVLSFVLALLIARRRSTTAALIGIGLAAVAVIWKLTADQVVTRVVAKSTGNPVAELFKNDFVTAAGAAFFPWIVTTLVIAAVLAVTGTLGRIFARS